MEIKNPKRLLLLSPSGTDIKPILNALTSTSTSTKSQSKAKDTPPAPATEVSVEGQAEGELIHHIKTPYYSAKVPIWVDEITDIEAWEKAWRGMDGASEVVAALGAVVVGVRKGEKGEEMKHLTPLLTKISSTLSHHLSTSYSTDEPLLLAVLLPSHPQPLIPSQSTPLSSADLDDLGHEAGGWEIIDLTSPSSPNEDGRLQNQYGEKSGLPRMLQALEVAEWEAAGGEAGDGDGDLDAEIEAQIEAAGVGGEGVEAGLFAGREGGNGGLGAGVEDMTSLEREIAAAMGEKGAKDLTEPFLPVKREKRRASEDLDDVGQEGREAAEDVKSAGNKSLGMKEGKAKGDEGEEEDVEDLQRFLSHFQAARDLGADLPEAERKRLAARAVREVMRGT